MPLFGMYTICNQVARTAKRAPYAPTIKMLRQAGEFPETGNSALQGRNFLFFLTSFLSCSRAAEISERKGPKGRNNIAQGEKPWVSTPHPAFGTPPARAGEGPGSGLGF
jgi:hypothetical protein